MRDVEELNILATVGTRDNSDVLVRLVVAPDRCEEVIDPVRLQSAELTRELYELGHRRSIDFWSYQRAKRTDIDGQWLDIAQESEERYHPSMASARIRVHEDGTLVLERNATGDATRDRDAVGLGLDGMVLAHEDVEQVLALQFAFAAAIFAHLDTYERHTRFSYQVALFNIGFRTFERNPRPRSSYSIPHRSADDPLLVLPQPRTISRQALAAPNAEVERVMAELTRVLTTNR